MRVLLVEDEVNLAHSVARGLAAEQMTVDVRGDGISGRDAARSGAYDVVVLDIMLPGLQGYRVLRELRAARVWTPVLMLTAKDGEHDEADAFDLGADDYLRKPFAFVVLVARLRALARRAATSPATMLRLGDLELDRARHRVRRNTAEIALSPREFAVLEHLMLRQGSVVSKTELLDAVWDEAFDGDVNNVETYISYLRKKVDVPFGRSSIQTVRGYGYRLSDEPT